MRIFLPLVLTPLLLLPSNIFAQAALRSPWDLHPVKHSTAHYACHADIHLPHDVTLYDYYSDSKHSIIDPTRHNAYIAASQPFQELLRATESAADSYTKNGSAEAAACTLHLLSVAAADDAMTGAMSANQAYYVQGWTLGGISIAYLKVRQAQPGTEAERAAVSAWLQRIAGMSHDYFQKHAEKDEAKQNNHLYWAGLGVLAAGVVTNNREDYLWGVGTYKKGIDSIAPDGTLPNEMARGQRALHYHLFALAPLVLIAEFGEANNEPLYNYRKSSIRLLIARCLNGMADPTFFITATGNKQEGNYKDPTAGDISWAAPYARRYPDPMLTRALASAHSLNDAYLGGLPPQ